MNNCDCDVDFACEYHAQQDETYWAEYFQTATRFHYTEADLVDAYGAGNYKTGYLL